MHLNSVAHLCALFASTSSHVERDTCSQYSEVPRFVIVLVRVRGEAEQIAHGRQAGAPRDHAALQVAAEEVGHIPARGRQEDLDYDDLEETADTVPHIVSRCGPEWHRQVLRRPQHPSMQEDDPAEVHGIMLDGYYPESLRHVALPNERSHTHGHVHDQQRDKMVHRLVGKGVLRSCCWVDAGLCEVVYRPSASPPGLVDAVCGKSERGQDDGQVLGESCNQLVRPPLSTLRGLTTTLKVPLSTSRTCCARPFADGVQPQRGRTPARLQSCRNR